MKCVHMTCHQCDDAQVAELNAALVNARGEMIAALAEEKAAVEAADRLTKERDEAVEALESLEAAILEVLPYQYDDGTDEEADPGECLGYAAEELAELRKKVAAASALEAVIATSASVEAQLRQERDEARAKYQWMVDRACDERLDGYRELGARAAAAENERDALLYRVDSLTAALRGLLLSRDASWTGGHDWKEAVDDAIKALGIESLEDA